LPAQAMTGLVISARGYRELELRGLPPGMFSTTEYETIQLQRGDSVIFLSDGVREPQNCAGDFFGMERVQEVCESLREKTPEEILGQLTEAVASYSCGRAQPDDRRAAVLRYMPI